MSKNSDTDKDEQAPKEEVESFEAPPTEDNSAQALAAFLKAEPEEPVEVEEEPAEEVVSKALIEEFKAEKPKEEATPVIRDIPDPDPEIVEPTAADEEEDDYEEEVPLVVEPRFENAPHEHIGL